MGIIGHARCCVSATPHATRAALERDLVRPKEQHRPADRVLRNPRAKCTYSHIRVSGFLHKAARA